jgi:hypothetical protein
MKMPVLRGSSSDTILKETTQVGRGADAGAPANLFET